jgi:hypothetical protein
MGLRSATRIPIVPEPSPVPAGGGAPASRRVAGAPGGRDILAAGMPALVAALARSRRPSSLALLVALALLAACGERTPRVATTSEDVAGSAARAPRAIALDPPNGARDVDPARTWLEVTFDRPMDPQGWAWVIEGPESAPEIAESSWDPEIRRNRVEVRLEPGREYVVWVNSPQFAYFRAPDGTPAEPLRWSFSTRAAAPAGGGELTTLPAHASGPPRVVSLQPANGAWDVDPATPLLRVTFDRPMQEGWSWVTEGGDSFPPPAGEARFENERTAAMPVRLEPGRTYVVWLNSERYQMFRDRSGTPLPPFRWTFSTRAPG